MLIRVRLHGHLHIYTESKKPEFELELPNGATLEELIRTLKIPDAEIWVVSLNGRSASTSAYLSDGDAVSVFPPVGGG